MRKIIAPIIFVVLTFFLNYSYALTPAELIQLKKAGVSEQTIQLMLKQEADAREREAYNRIGTREVTDKHGNTYTVYSTGDSTIDQEEKQKAENAWKMLQNMVIDRENQRPAINHR